MKPQRVVITNAKGGCGKTTIATNLVAALNHYGVPTSLFDYDPQGSSSEWLKQRDEDRPAIHGVSAWRKPEQGTTRSFQLRVPQNVKLIVKDTPAGVGGPDLVKLVQEADSIIIPVLPSPIDIHAAANFIRDLLLIGKARTYKTRIAVVANRARQNTLMYQSLQRFLNTLKIPFVTTLRDTQHYVRAAAEGIGVHELQGPRIQTDIKQWEPLLAWVSEGNHPLSVSDVVDLSRPKIPPLPDTRMNDSVYDINAAIRR